MKSPLTRKGLKREKCYWCGRADLTQEPNRPNTRTKDHLVPKPYREKGKEHGTVIACRDCNTRRGDAPTGGVPGTCIKMRAFEAKRFGI